jgi:glycosyltransferase involved in cell wall biosynthesis
MIVNINAPINVTSYGYVSCNVIKELKKLGVDLRHIPIGQNIPDEEILPDIKDVLTRWDYSFDAPCLKIWHQHDLDAFYGKGIRIGMPIFELEKFNKKETHSLQNPDKLFACSHWAKEVIEANVPNSIGNTHVTPLGVDGSIFKPCPLPIVDKTIFGNFGKFETRKGHDVLPDIFNKAFEKDDDVFLIMMPHNFFLNQEETNEWVNKYKNTKLGDKIIFFERQRSQKMVYNIMSQIHCGIFPSRAEGWNLEALELLATGRHLIITNATAHTEFCNEDNSHLINMESGYEPAKDIKFFNGEFEWRKFGDNEVEQTIEYMRMIHKKRKDGKLSLNTSGIETGKHFTWENTAKTIKDKIWNFLA